MQTLAAIPYPLFILIALFAIPVVLFIALG